MSKRLDQKREKILTPKRFDYAVEQITSKGYVVHYKDDNRIEFFRKQNKLVVFFPYSGWFSGKGIGHGRGIKNLIKLI